MIGKLAYFDLNNVQKITRHNEHWFLMCNGLVQLKTILPTKNTILRKQILEGLLYTVRQCTLIQSFPLITRIIFPYFVLSRMTKRKNVMKKTNSRIFLLELESKYNAYSQLLHEKKSVGLALPFLKGHISIVELNTMPFYPPYALIGSANV